MCAFLHAEHCPWNTTTCALAASNGHCSTLRWLREHGCPWLAASIALAAAEGGSVDVMAYLQQQGIVRKGGLLTQMLNVAGAYNQLAAAEWLRALGAEWPVPLCWDRQRSADTLQWIRAEGCTTPLLPCFPHADGA
jgi:hypothetical protein